MNPRHHPSDATLTAYAAGNLRAGFGLVVAAHLDRCSQCRALVRACERVGGALIQDLEPVEVSPDALDAIMARLDERQSPPPAGPPPLRGAFIDRLPIGKKRWAAPGVWVAAVDTPHAPSDRVYLLNVPAHGATARHTHAGQEFTYVVSGALKDGETVYAAGDFVELDETVEHHPVVHGDEPCLCLFATEGRLKPSGWIGGIAFAIADV